MKYFNVDFSDWKFVMDNCFEMMIVDDKKVRFCNGILVVSFVEREIGDFFFWFKLFYVIEIVKYVLKYFVFYFLWLKLICCVLFFYCFVCVIILFFDINNLIK